jgi:hypothetical protein
VTALRLASGVVEGGVVAARVLDDRLGRVATALLSEHHPFELGLSTGDYFACLQLPDGNELIEPFTVEDPSQTLTVGAASTEGRTGDAALGSTQPGQWPGGRPGGPVGGAPMPYDAVSETGAPDFGIESAWRLAGAWQQGSAGRRPALHARDWQLGTDGWSAVQRRHPWTDWDLGVPLQPVGDPAMARGIVLAGSFLPDRVLLVPPGPSVRLHATPGLAEGGLEGQVAVSVTTGDAILDTLVGHLAAGRTRAAAVAADALLVGSIEPEVSVARATVVAYYLLSYGDPARATWTGQLFNVAPHFPDAAIVHAWRLLYEDSNDAITPLALLTWAAGIGPPVYSLGLRRLIDGLLILAKNARLGDEDILLARRALQAAELFGSSASPTATHTSYHGRAPARPAMRSRPHRENPLEDVLARLRGGAAARLITMRWPSDVQALSAGVAESHAIGPAGTAEPGDRQLLPLLIRGAVIAGTAVAVGSVGLAAIRRLSSARPWLGYFLGGALVYVLGARVGRERYEQLAEMAAWAVRQVSEQAGRGGQDVRHEARQAAQRSRAHADAE